MTSKAVFYMHNQRIIHINPKCSLGSGFHLTDVRLFQLFHENSEIIKRRMRNSFKSALMHMVQYKGRYIVSVLLFERHSMVTVHGSTRATVIPVNGSWNLLN